MTCSQTTCASATITTIPHNLTHIAFTCCHLQLLTSSEAAETTLELYKYNNTCISADEFGTAASTEFIRKKLARTTAKNLPIDKTLTLSQISWLQEPDTTAEQAKNAAAAPTIGVKRAAAGAPFPAV